MWAENDYLPVDKRTKNVQHDLVVDIVVVSEHTFHSALSNDPHLVSMWHGDSFGCSGVPKRPRGGVFDDVISLIGKRNLGRLSFICS